MLSYKEYLQEKKKDPCWTGYKKVPGKKDYEEDSCVKEGKRGLWDNIHAKQKRIANGSGERMRKPGSKGAPTDAALKASQTNEELSIPKDAPSVESIAAKHNVSVEEIKKQLEMGVKIEAEHGNNPGTEKEIALDHLNEKPDYYTRLKKVEEQFDIIEEMVMSLAEKHNVDPEIIWEKFEEIEDAQLLEYAVDAKGHKSSTGGLTQKGRDAYNAKGANLKPPVTTPPSKLKAGSKAANRRKSFCARMGGMEGPMKKPNGEPTRKALALRKWNC